MAATTRERVDIVALMRERFTTALAACGIEASAALEEVCAGVRRDYGGGRYYLGEIDRATRDKTLCVDVFVMRMPRKEALKKAGLSKRQGARVLKEHLAEQGRHRSCHFGLELARPAADDESSSILKKAAK